MSLNKSYKQKINTSNNTELSDEQYLSSLSLTAKLQLIGVTYLELYQAAGQYGPLSRHTNQVQAKILENLPQDNEHLAFQVLISTLSLLPNKGQLSELLIETISNHLVNDVDKILDAHNISENDNRAPKGSYYYEVIYQFAKESLSGLADSFNQKFAQALNLTKGISKRQEINPKLGMNNDQESSNNKNRFSLGHLIKKVGDTYIEQHPKASSMFAIHNRHTHQVEAKSLQALSGKTNSEVMNVINKMLPKLSSGQLSKAIKTALLDSLTISLTDALEVGNSL